MKFSAFSRFGHLRFTGDAPPGERIYDSLVRAYGGDDVYDTTWGSEFSNRCYAFAMALADFQRTLERVGNNADPSTADEALAQFEHDYGIVPDRGATLTERRAVAAARIKLSRGATYEHIRSSLQLVLGSHLVAYRPLGVDEAETWPASPSASGTFHAGAKPLKVYRTVGSILPGAQVTFDVTYVAGSTDFIQRGEVFVLDPGATGQQESVTISDEVVQASPGAQATVITALTKTHEAGTLLTTAAYPFWCSSSRHNLVVVSASLVQDPEARRKTANVLHELLSGVSTFLICTETSPGSGTVGPFTVGGGLIGFTPIGEITL